MLCSDGQRNFVILIGKFEFVPTIYDYYSSVGGSANPAAIDAISGLRGLGKKAKVEAFTI